MKDKYTKPVIAEENLIIPDVLCASVEFVNEDNSSVDLQNQTIIILDEIPGME